MTVTDGELLRIKDVGPVAVRLRAAKRYKGDDA